MNQLSPYTRQPLAANNDAFGRELRRRLEQMGYSGAITEQAITHISSTFMYGGMEAVAARYRLDVMRHGEAALGTLTPGRDAFYRQLEDDLHGAIRSALALHSQQMLQLIDEAGRRRSGPGRFLPR